MKEPPFFGQPTPPRTRLLEPPHRDLTAQNVVVVLGLMLLIAWVRFAPRFKVRRWGTWFWLGLAFSALAGPLLGSLMLR